MPIIAELYCCYVCGLSMRYCEGDVAKGLVCLRVEITQRRKSIETLTVVQVTQLVVRLKREAHRQ